MKWLARAIAAEAFHMEIIHLEPWQERSISSWYCCLFHKNLRTNVGVRA